MSLAAIKKEDLNRLVAAVREHGRFYAPVTEQGSPVGRAAPAARLAEVAPDDALTYEYGNFALPPKRLFFPRSEVLAEHGPDGMVEALPPTEKAVIFGVRPCDALALTYLDKVFLDDKFADPYYRRRRQNAVIISLACGAPAETCFCTSVNGSPGGRAGADILAVDVGSTLVLESATAAGAAFLAEHGKLFKKPTAAQLKARDARLAEAAKLVGAVPAAEARAHLQAGAEPTEWDEIAERCLGCGICTYLCPTCHCFGLHDEQVGGRDRRIRTQDACAFPAFTQEASGHNPRTRQGLRMRQRVLHKFLYAAENFGDIFCVGCGRCIGGCPANVDIRETLLVAAQARRAGTAGTEVSK